MTSEMANAAEEPGPAGSAISSADLAGRRGSHIVVIDSVGSVMRFLVFIAIIHGAEATPAWAQVGSAPPDGSTGEQPTNDVPPLEGGAPPATGEVIPPAPPPPISAPTLAPCVDTTVLPQPARECLQAPRARWLRAGRIGLEAVMGTGLGAVPEVLGAYVGLSIDVTRGHEAGAGLDLGTALGAAVGVGSAVYLAGYLMSGDGAYGWSVLGSTAGTGVAAAVLSIKSTSATLVFAAALPIAGAIAGYELSSHDRRARRFHGISLVPAFGPSSFGLAGAF